jgi:hypothetical protein
MTPEERYRALMTQARAFNDQMDATEHEVGFSTPVEAGPRQLLLTAMEAIKAGIGTEDWTCVAEGQVMLEQFCHHAGWQPTTQR